MSTNTNDTEDEQAPGGGPMLSRRGALKAGAAGAGLVAGASMLPGEYSPVQEAEAVAPLVVAAGKAAVAGAGAGLVAGAGARHMYDRWTAPDDVDEDELDPELDDYAAQNAYQAARAVQIEGAFGRQQIAESHGVRYDPDEDEYDTYEDEPLDTRFGRTVWDEVRATVANGIASDDSTAEIETDSLEAIDRRVIRAAVEVVATWNNTVEAMAHVFTADVEHSLNVFSAASGTNTYSLDSLPYEPGEDTDGEVVSETSDGDPTVGKEYAELPIPIHALEGFDEDEAEDIGDGDPYRLPLLLVGNSDDRVHYPDSIDNIIDVEVPAEDEFSRSSGDVWAEDPDDTFDDATVLDRDLINGTSIGNIASVQDEIRDKIEDYVAATMDATDDDDIDPEDLLGPGEIIEDDAVSEGDAITRQLIAAGVTPDDAREMTIEHPDVGETTGFLFVDLTEDVDAREGESLPADLIDQAVLFEVNEDDESGDDDDDDGIDEGAFDATVLDPDEDIDIVELDREEVEIDADDPVTVDDEDDELILDAGTPLDDLDGDYVVLIEYEDPDGADDVLRVPVDAWDEYSDDGEEWIVTLPDDVDADDIDTVQDVSIDGAIDGTARVDSPINPSEGEDLSEQIEQYQEARAELEAAIAELEDAADGDGLFGGGGGLGGSTGSLIALIAAALGIGWLLQD